MKKSVYKSAMSHVKTSEDFKEATYQKLMLEMEKTTQPNKTNLKESMHMEKTMKRKLTGWTVGIAACAVLSIGIYAMSQNAPAPTPTPTPTETASNAPATAPAATTPSETPAEATKPPIMGKVRVNIDGVISEVSADGKSFKVGDLWVTVTPETIMGIDGPTAAEPSDELLQKEFKVGNIVSGFTSDDVSTGKVNATRIYNNMAPQK
ncbi:hypothetical protein [Paenibacillus montanisoli]|uniref:DUF5666 domain-containing protein n=1 Tax=Paenibacillus montanisoli TaxID=2081970 RepID=A0A328TUN4_9BACL|nr:hypothetical protein [Paenibacillus montanisoli]RAP74217.1 hypothetical protein DL346_24470 [Paenibacillus montanisoli]